MQMAMFGSEDEREKLLQERMYSALKAKTDALASTLFKHKWKIRMTPQGTQIISLRATQGKPQALTSWRTPKERDHHPSKLSGNPDRQKQVQLAHQAELASWLTPKLPSGGGQMERQSTSGGLRKLEDQVLMTSWRSPSATDGDGGVMEIREGADGRYKLRDEAILAGWPSPTVIDSAGVMKSPEALAKSRLRGIKGGIKAVGGPPSILCEKVQLISGPTPNGSGVPTGSGGRMVLNPSLSRWLQGLPPEWCILAPSAKRKR